MANEPPKPSDPDPTERALDAIQAAEKRLNESGAADTLKEAEKLAQRLDDPAVRDVIERVSDQQKQIEKKIGSSGLPDAIKHLADIETRLAQRTMPVAPELSEGIVTFNPQLELLRATRQLGESIEDMAEDLREDIGILVAVSRAQLAGLTVVAEATKATGAETAELGKLVRSADKSARNSQRWLIALTFLVAVLAALQLNAQVNPAKTQAPVAKTQSPSPTPPSASPVPSGTK